MQFQHEGSYQSLCFPPSSAFPARTCTVPNPLLTFNVNGRAGRAYTCYIIGNPWSGLFRVYVLED